MENRVARAEKERNEALQKAQQELTRARELTRRATDRADAADKSALEAQRALADLRAKKG